VALGDGTEEKKENICTEGKGGEEGNFKISLLLEEKHFLHDER
jgi:hypothetical protein